jgi:hypothetical protein
LNVFELFGSAFGLGHDVIVGHQHSIGGKQVPMWLDDFASWAKREREISALAAAMLAAHSMELEVLHPQTGALHGIERAFERDLFELRLGFLRVGDEDEIQNVIDLETAAIILVGHSDCDRACFLGYEVATLVIWPSAHGSWSRAKLNTPFGKTVAGEGEIKRVDRIAYRFGGAKKGFDLTDESAIEGSPLIHVIWTLQRQMVGFAHCLGHNVANRIPLDGFNRREGHFSIGSEKLANRNIRLTSLDLGDRVFQDKNPRGILTHEVIRSIPYDSRSVYIWLGEIVL